jgi:hypothetical protein
LLVSGIDCATDNGREGGGDFVPPKKKQVLGKVRNGMEVNKELSAGRGAKRRDVLRQNLIYYLSFKIILTVFLAAEVPSTSCAPISEVTLVSGRSRLKCKRSTEIYWTTRIGG